MTPPLMTVEVSGDGTGEAEFTIVNPRFTGDIEIGVEDIPLSYEPTVVSVEAGVNKKVVITFYGDETLGSTVFRGKITFLPPTGAMFVVGYKVPTDIIHRVAGVPMVIPTPTLTPTPTPTPRPTPTPTPTPTPFEEEEGEGTAGWVYARDRGAGRSGGDPG